VPPGGVTPAGRDGHLSSRAVAGTVEQPTRGSCGPDRSCPHIWPCFRWGLPSRPVTRPLVRSYI